MNGDSTDTGDFAEADELLAQRRWLHALARSLVKDGPTADDLVQDTVIAALRRPPERALRPWLAKIARNLAVQRLRSDGRRGRREEVASRVESLPSASELAERMEGQRRLVEAVLALDEPYKSAIVLRFYEGRSAAEIARRRGVNASTVRTQIARGLGALRRELDDGTPGGRTAWVSALLPWTSSPRVGGGAAASLSQGAIAMSIGWKLGSAAAAAVLLAVGWTVATRDGDARAPLIAAAPSEASARIDRGPDVSAPEVDGPREVVDLGGAELTKPVYPAVVADDLATNASVVEVQIVDAALEPIDGAEFGLQMPPAGSARLETADAEGRVRYEIDFRWFDEGVVPLVARAPGFAQKQLFESVERGATRDLGQIVLQRGAEISGRVVDHDGLPAVGARIELSRGVPGIPIGLYRHAGPSSWDSLGRTTSDVDGSFELFDVSPEAHYIFARSSDSLWTFATLTLEAGTVVDDLVLRLEPVPIGERVEGIVLEPDGSPASGALIICEVDGLGGGASYFERADGEGRFELLIKEAKAIRAADERGRWPNAVAPSLALGGELVLQFREARQLVVDARDEDGESVPSVAIEAIVEATGGTTPGSGASLLEPDAPFSIRVGAPGFAPTILGPFARGEATTRLTCELERISGLHGRVVAGAFGDTPVPGARVELFALAATTGEYSELVYYRGFRSRVQFFPLATTRTDEDGGFVFHPPTTGAFVVRAESGASDGLAPAETPVHVATLAGAQDSVLVRLSMGGAIEGRLLAAGGEGVDGQRVIASRADARFAETRADADGRYRFEGLMPGAWNVEAVADAIEGMGETHRLEGELPEVPWTCEVWAGETTRYDIDLRDLERCGVRGRILANGEPLVGWSVALNPDPETGYYGRPSLTPRTELDANGSFELRVPRDGGYRVWIHDPASDLSLRFPVELEEGVATRNVEFATGRVELTGIPGTIAGLHIAWDGPGGETASAHVAPDGDGNATLERFPAGDVHLFHYEKAGRPPVVLLRGVVRAGETTRLSVP